MANSSNNDSKSGATTTTSHAVEHTPLLDKTPSAQNDENQQQQEAADSPSSGTTAAGSFSKRQLKLRRFSTFWPSERELLFRHPSLELLVPAHDCASRKSSPAIAIFNLVATVCGGGVLSLPQAFLRAGIVPSSLLMVFAAGVTHFSMYILCSCARRTGGRSYGDVTRNAFGPMAEIVTTMLLIFLLLMVLVAYHVLLKDIWTPVLLKCFPILLTIFLSHHPKDNAEINDSGDMIISDQEMEQISYYMLVVLLVLVVPLLLQTDLHALRHTCYVGFASAVVLMLGVSRQAIYRNLFQEPGLFAEKVVWVGDANGIMYAFPIIVLSFFSIYNVLTVHGALFNPTRSRVRVVLDGTIGLCFILFYTVGLCGYLYAYEDTKDNILLNFDLSVTSILIGRIGYGITIMFGMPLVFLPCRAAILSLPEQLRSRNQAVNSGEAAVQAVMKGTRHHVANSLTFDEECPLWMETTTPTSLERPPSTDLSSAATPSPQSRKREKDVKVVPLPKVDPSLGREAGRDQVIHVLSTVIILVSTYVTAVGVPGVGVVWSIAGSSMAMIIGFIIPAACYLKIRSKKSINPRSIGAFLLLIFSIVASIECTVRTISNL